jgi:hypothetical protein
VTGTIALFAALTLTAFAVVGSATTSATSPPGADQFALDMKPHVAPANTATSLGPIHPCAALFQNGVLDADEIVIDTIEFDVVTGPLGIPAANPMTGYDYTLDWSTVGISIVSQTPLLIDANIGSNVVNSSDSLPDSDGSWSASVSDTGPIPSSAETGQGVLDRIRLTTNGAAPFGVYVLSIASAHHTDTGGQQHTPDSLLGALLEIDSGGCGAYVDLTLESQTPTPPTIMAAGFDWQLSIDGVVGNNGPDTEPGLFPTVTTTLTPPADCAINGQAGADQVLNSVPIPQVWSTESYRAVAQINCSNGGPHQVTSEACVSMGAFPDIDGSNNCNSVLINFDVDDSDTDGDGFSDEDEVGTPLCNGINDDDHDDAVVDDGCPGGPPQAGEFSEAQFNIGTDPLVACTPGGSIDVWPPELAIGSIPNSTNIINIVDLSRFIAPVRRISTSPGDPTFDPRYDISPGRGGPAKWINVIDMSMLLTFAPVFSPVLYPRPFNSPAAC